MVWDVLPKTSVFPNKTAPSYARRHLKLLLFVFGGSLSLCWDFTILAPQGICRCLAQSNSVCPAGS